MTAHILALDSDPFGLVFSASSNNSVCQTPSTFRPTLLLNRTLPLSFSLAQPHFAIENFALFQFVLPTTYTGPAGVCGESSLSKTSEDVGFSGNDGTAYSVPSGAGEACMSNATQEGWVPLFYSLQGYYEKVATPENASQLFTQYVSAYMWFTPEQVIHRYKQCFRALKNDTPCWVDGSQCTVPQAHCTHPPASLLKSKPLVRFIRAFDRAVAMGRWWSDGPVIVSFARANLSIRTHNNMILWQSGSFDMSPDGDQARLWFDPITKAMTVATKANLRFWSSVPGPGLVNAFLPLSSFSSCYNPSYNFFFDNTETF